MASIKSGSIKFDKNGKQSISWEICEKCDTFNCVSICPNNALKQCVKEYTVDEVIAILRCDFNNWGPKGGVTFSGGDPLIQHEICS